MEVYVVMYHTKKTGFGRVVLTAESKKDALLKADKSPEIVYHCGLLSEIEEMHRKNRSFYNKEL